MEVFEEKKTVSGRKTWTTVDLSAHKEINASGPVSGCPCITHPKGRIELHRTAVRPELVSQVCCKACRN